MLIFKISFMLYRETLTTTHLRVESRSVIKRQMEWMACYVHMRRDNFFFLMEMCEEGSTADRLSACAAEETYASTVSKSSEEKSENWLTGKCSLTGGQF